MIVLSTGTSGRVCNPAAWDALRAGASALDAVQAGLTAAEADPACDDVGYGGRPDAGGRLSVDAAIMDGPSHRAGAVAGLYGCRNPIAVARRVMESTPHVFLVGQGARDFATAQGFAAEGPLLTPEAEAAYAAFRRGERAAAATGNSHDTVGCCALDGGGSLAVGCSTSGLDFKMPGRVGDSPIIGSGLYVENAVGAAACNGIGEQMMQVCLAFRIVAAMSRGLSPADACAESLRALLTLRPSARDLPCACIALNARGNHGAASTRSDFVYYVSAGGETVSRTAPYVDRA
jgi:N4-(beta-N-acetylglucosaminyl)-L-asparaginase